MGFLTKFSSVPAVNTKKIETARIRRVSEDIPRRKSLSYFDGAFAALHAIFF